MKVLFAVPYIYSKNYPKFTKNPTGFGMLVEQIFEYVSDKNDVYLISHVLTKGYGNILPHTIGDVLRHVRFRDILQGMNWAIHYKQGLKGRIKYFYYCLNKGYARYIIKKLKPDVVHIHSLGMRNKVFIEICEELGQKYIVTLHGLIGLNNSVQAPKWDKAYEKEVLQRCEEQNIPVTVISTGIKNRIEKHYLKDASRSITVVTNGTKVTPIEGELHRDLRREYHIPEGVKIAVVVGNISVNKNQIQIVDAVAGLLEKRKDIVVFLCGKDTIGGKVRERIDACGLGSHIFELGFVPYEQLGNVYKQADFNILASINDGFGLSIVEAFVYGLPTVTFGDLDAIPDLYNEKAMLLCEDRSTEALSAAIDKAMDAEWDAESIRAYSKNFSLEKMAENYQRVYEQTVR